MGIHAKFVILYGLLCICDEPMRYMGKGERTSYAFNIRTGVVLGEKIVKEAERRGETASFVFREAVREYLARLEKKQKES